MGAGRRRGMYQAKHSAGHVQHVGIRLLTPGVINLKDFSAVFRGLLEW